MQTLATAGEEPIRRDQRMRSTYCKRTARPIISLMWMKVQISMGGGEEQPVKALVNTRSMVSLLSKSLYDALFLKDILLECRRFCENHSAVLYHLSMLTRKDARFVWGKEHETASQCSKSAMLKHPVMAHQDFSRPFTVMTDASVNAIGAISAQYDKTGREHLVACISQTLKDVEKRYNIRSQEALAI